MTSSTIRAHDSTSPYEEASKFIEALLENTPGDQFLEIRTIAPGGKPSQRWHEVSDLRELGFSTALPIAADGKTNIYYGAAVRSRKGGKGPDVGASGAVWFDEIYQATPADTLPFSGMVETSPGKVQGGYFLTEYTTDLKCVENLNRRLRHVLDGDTVHNRDRILRLPGFKNVKYEHQPRAFLSEFHPDRRYTLDELDAALPALPVEESQDRVQRECTGRFDPHFGTALKGDDQTRLAPFLASMGLRRQNDGRFVGSCPFDHGCDCDSAFYISAETGNWSPGPGAGPRVAVGGGFA